MQKTIEVVYENGVLKPLEPVEKSPLEESFGIWTGEKGGIEYVNKIRDEAEKRLMEKGID